jgi:hypothetical protein
MAYGLPYWGDTIICRQYEQTGFGYADYLRRVDGYGLSLADPQWVADQVAHNPRLRMVAFLERGWHDVHDIYACKRVPNGEVKASPIPLSQFLKHSVRSGMPEPLVELLKRLLGKG